MMGTDNERSADAVGIKSKIAYCICISVLLLVSCFVQVMGAEILSVSPPIAFALICAVGFVLGERFGAVFGIIAGVTVTYLGSFGFSFAPLTYMLCGYLCGALRGWILSFNFLSFLIYGAAAGGIYEIFSAINFIMISSSFDPLTFIVRIGVREYIAYICCIIPMYFAVLGIFKLFKGKDGKTGHKL